MISNESDAVIEQKMQDMFPKTAEKIANVPYVIEPSKPHEYI